MSDLVDSLSRNLRGYWCPMLQYGGLTLRDQTRLKNHGTLTNMDTSTDWVMSRVRGRSGRVLDFDGTDDHVFVQDSQSLDFTSSLSLSFWARTGSDVSAVRMLAAKAIISPLQLSYRVWIQTRLNFQISQDGGVTNIGTRQSSPLGTNRLYHFFVRFVGGSIQDIFVDGSIDNALFSGTIRPSIYSAPTATPLIIGAQAATATTTSGPFTGQIAEVAAWNRALSPGEIQELYRLGPGWYQPQLPRRFPYSEQQAEGFKAYWARRQSQLIGGGV